MKLLRLLQLFAVIVLLTGCETQKIAYFEDVIPGVQEEIKNVKDIRIKPEDKITIVISGRDPMISNLFNLPLATQRVGQVNKSGDSYPQGILGYTVDKEGYIDFPVVGKIKIAGMNREEISEYIKEKLVSDNLIKDPIVTVDFVNLTFSVLGEVKTPGRFHIEKDKVTLLEALSMAGDLTLHGLRDKVLVQRDENGKPTIYKVDLNSGKDLYASPVYYMQQNDIIYVAPNKYKEKDATVNEKALRWSSIFIAVASLLTTITVAIVK